MVLGQGLRNAILSHGHSPCSQTPKRVLIKSHPQCNLENQSFLEHFTGQKLLKFVLSSKEIELF